MKKQYALDLAKDHIRIIGEIVAATNQLQDYFFNLFHVVLSLEREGRTDARFRMHNHALEVWHIIQSDSSQRDMALKALSTVPSSLNLKPAIQRIEWAVKKANKFSSVRNIVAHIPISFTIQQDKNGLKWVPSFSGTGARTSMARRAKAIPNLKFWNRFRDDIFKLSTYVMTVAIKVYQLELTRKGFEVPADELLAWPRKPQLPSLLNLAQIDKSLNIQKATPKPKRKLQRKSSRP